MPRRNSPPSSIPDLPTQLGSDAKLAIRLRLPLLIELDGRSVGAFDPRRLELIMKQPSGDNASLPFRDHGALAKAYKQLLPPVPPLSPAASPRSARGRWAGQAAGRQSAVAGFSSWARQSCSLGKPHWYAQEIEDTSDFRGSETIDGKTVPPCRVSRPHGIGLRSGAFLLPLRG